MKTWSQFKTELPLVESVIPMNRQYGFLGTAGDQAHDLLSKAVAHVKKANEGNKEFQMSDQTISHFLDSKGGRHLADLMTSKAPPELIQRALKASLTDFSKTYNPSLYESYADLHENDPHLTRTQAHAQSIEGRMAAAKRLAANKKAREEYLAKQRGEHKPEPKKEEPKKEPAKKPAAAQPTHQPSTGIYHANPAKRAEAHRHLRKIMDKPLKAHEASEKIKKHFDDERLHSDLHHFAKHNPDIDVRPLVKKRMEQLRKQRGF
jgi:hypothetical protein